jgi:hypothetical protein
LRGFGEAHQKVTRSCEYAGTCPTTSVCVALCSVLAGAAVLAQPYSIRAQRAVLASCLQMATMEAPRSGRASTWCPQSVCYLPHTGRRAQPSCRPSPRPSPSVTSARCLPMQPAQPHAVRTRVFFSIFYTTGRIWMLSGVHSSDCDRCVPQLLQ